MFFQLALLLTCSLTLLGTADIWTDSLCVVSQWKCRKFDICSSVLNKYIYIHPFLQNQSLVALSTHSWNAERAVESLLNSWHYYILPIIYCFWLYYILTSDMCCLSILATSVKAFEWNTQDSFLCQNYMFFLCQLNGISASSVKLTASSLQALDWSWGILTAIDWRNGAWRLIFSK